MSTTDKGTITHQGYNVNCPCGATEHLFASTKTNAAREAGDLGWHEFPRSGWNCPKCYRRYGGDLTPEELALGFTDEDEEPTLTDECIAAGTDWAPKNPEKLAAEIKSLAMGVTRSEPTLTDQFIEATGGSVPAKRKGVPPPYSADELKGWADASLNAELRLYRDLYSTTYCKASKADAGRRVRALFAEVSRRAQEREEARASTSWRRVGGP